MALLTILEFPDPRLRKIAVPVAAVTPEIRKLVRDMAETMYAAPGVGLAATQVDVHKRIIVMDISDTRAALRVYINPEILSASGEAEAAEADWSEAVVWKEAASLDDVSSPVRGWGPGLGAPVGGPERSEMVSRMGA